MTNRSFVRYYINEMQYSLASQIQNLLPQIPELQNWLWIPASQFNYEQSYGYLLGSNSAEIECIKSHCTAVIEHHDAHQVAGTSLIWTLGGGSIPTLIDDILMLLSIARGQYIYARTQEILHPSGNLEIIHRPNAPLTEPRDIIPLPGLQPFISDSLATLQHHNWKESTGFVPAVHWLAQAQRLFHAGIFGLEFSLYWLALEVLAGAYVNNRGESRKPKNKADRVKTFVASRGFGGSQWSFLDDAIADWYDVRCYAFHEGKLPRWEKDRFERRWRQLSEFTCFVLAALLQKQNQSHMDNTAVRLSSYTEVRLTQ